MSAGSICDFTPPWHIKKLGGCFPTPWRRELALDVDVGRGAARHTHDGHEPHVLTRLANPQRSDRRLPMVTHMDERTGVTGGGGGK